MVVTAGPCSLIRVTETPRMIRFSKYVPGETRIVSPFAAAPIPAWIVGKGASCVPSPGAAAETSTNQIVCVAEDDIIIARFTEQVAAADGAFTLEDSSGTFVDGTVTVSDTVASFTSTLALSSNEVYTVRLTDALTDLAGNALAPADWSFRTQLAPEGTWVPIATPETFGPRTGHKAVWTGSEMIVWAAWSWGIRQSTTVGATIRPRTAGRPRPLSERPPPERITRRCGRGPR